MVRERSKYWSAFNVKGNVALCKLCDRKLSIANKSTNSLIRHLRAKHEIYSIEKQFDCSSCAVSTSVLPEPKNMKEDNFKEESIMEMPIIESKPENNESECRQEELSHRKNQDELKQFFDAMLMTVRKLPPVTIAKIKLQISQIVGQEEIAWAEKSNK